MPDELKNCLSENAVVVVSAKRWPPDAPAFDRGSQCGRLPPLGSLASQGDNRPNEGVNRPCFKQSVGDRSPRNTVVSDIDCPEHQPENDPDACVDGPGSGRFYFFHVVPRQCTNEEFAFPTHPPVIAQSLATPVKAPRHSCMSLLECVSCGFALPHNPARKPVLYRDNPVLTCGFAKTTFRVSRIPRPQKCPVKVP